MAHQNTIYQRVIRFSPCSFGWRGGFRGKFTSTILFKHGINDGK